jgi:hypothetical protein
MTFHCIYPGRNLLSILTSFVDQAKCLVKIYLPNHWEGFYSNEQRKIYYITSHKHYVKLWTLKDNHKTHLYYVNIIVGLRPSAFAPPASERGNCSAISPFRIPWGRKGVVSWDGYPRTAWEQAWWDEAFALPGESVAVGQKRGWVERSRDVTLSGVARILLPCCR